MNTSTKIKYGLLILKRDQDHIQVMETEDFKEADKLWEDLTERWTTCLSETKPFRLRSPIITSFDPGLIYEITIRPVTESTRNPDNPYQAKMQKEGFSATFRGEVLDGGYK